ERGNVLPFKRHQNVGIHNSAAEHLGIRVKIYLASKALVCYHPLPPFHDSRCLEDSPGSTPASSRSRNAVAMCHLLALSPGCGRWKYAETPFKVTMIAEPFPCLTTAPKCTRRLSMSAQRRLDGRGRLLMALS